MVSHLMLLDIQYLVDATDDADTKLSHHSRSQCKDEIKVSVYHTGV